ncbi:chemotaxis protein CheA [Erythrobacter sp. LQ02-29]|uniref:chemotaxis protein CheA n=1 Tax=Erythrobacter sp. LQ02-29 TaxID=2920384 RepID=UPI001F4E01E4|nr:chemotaxis protein CheA [Erythrobacter sp. LQ02-29]
MDMNEIEAIFFQECEEGLSGMEACFAELQGADQDPETINTIFRHVHSIKGGAGAFGLEQLQHYAHHYESLLDLVRSGKIALDRDLMDLMLGAFDMLADHVNAAREHGEPPADESMIERLDARCQATATAAAEAPASAEDAPTATPEQAQAEDDGFDDLMAMLGPTPSVAEPANETEPSSTTEQEADDWVLNYCPAPNALANGAEPLLILRELAALGARDIRCDHSTLPALGAFDPETAYLRWTLRIPANVAEEDIRTPFEFSEPESLTLARASAETEQEDADPADAAPEAAPVVQPAPVAEAKPEPASAPATPAARPSPAAPPAPSATIRVDLAKLDRLVNLVGELVITQSMLSQRLLDDGAGHADELADLELLTRELQESTMAIRAQPMKTVYSRIPRLIRDLEAETGKRVRLELEGEMTEVDKTVIERIGEPLTHLIRNAVDHGLEGPEGRVAAGKPEEGLIRLSATHQSGRIVIAVSDDGKGIDREKVRARAIQQGIVHADAVLTDEEIDALIFAPGFSTAEAVSNISGRGVGMDVVRKNIQALGGRITITSRPGHGSIFSFSLPLTLAVLDGMVVTVGDQTMVVPLSHVIENIRPTPEAVKPYGASGHLLNVRGTYVPILSVASALAIDERERDPRDGVLIVVDGDHGQVALMVDSIDDQRQVVVKSLEANFQPVAGIAGATILGDGKVALIVDAHELLSRHRGAAAPAALADAA